MQMTLCYYLQGVIDRLTENGRYFEMKKKVENSKLIGIWRQPSPLQVKKKKKQLENME
jgi:hypothetical protein